MPHATDAAVTFPVGGRRLRIAGNVAFCRDVAMLCDGSRSVDEIAAAFEAELEDKVRAFVGMLVDRGVAVDCTQAYRHLDANCGPGSPYAPRGDRQEVLRALESWAPRPLHVEEAAEALDPQPTQVQQISERRRSCALEGEPRSISFAELSAVLAAMYGRGPTGHRVVPSGGAIYPLLIQPLVPRPLVPLEPGLWWYDPDRAALRLCRSRNLSADGLIARQPGLDRLLAGAGAIVFVSADLDASSEKYGNHAYRLALMEAGAVMQNAYLVAAELGLPIRALSGLFDAPARGFLGLANGALPLLAIALGG